jgi:hypothetical protein
VIGGFSVIYHGYIRATKDSDLLVLDTSKQLLLTADGDRHRVPPADPGELFALRLSRVSADGASG